MRFTVRGEHPNAEWRPSDPHALKGTRCVLRDRTAGRISHAYEHPRLGLRCYVVLDNKQAAWFPFAALAL